MKCQNKNCESNEATVLFRYSNSSPLGFCQSCADKSVKFCAKPNRIKVQPLTAELEKLLLEMYSATINLEE